MSNSWYGYVHINGSLHVKRLLDDGDLKEARESDFVRRVYGPWEVDTRDEATKRLRDDMLSHDPDSPLFP